MSEFGSSYLDRQNQQDAYENARAEASGVAQASSAEFARSLGKFEKQKEDADSQYEQFKQVLEFLGTPLTEEGVKSLAKLGIEKLRNRVGKASRDLINKYGDQARQKLEAGIAELRSKGVVISDAVKNRLLDNVDKLSAKNPKIQESIQKGKDIASAGASGVAKQLEDVTTASNDAVRQAKQQGIAGTSVSETSFMTDKPTTVTYAKAPAEAKQRRGKKLKAPIGDEDNALLPRANKVERRNFRGLPKPESRDQVIKRLAPKQSIVRAVSKLSPEEFTKYREQREAFRQEAIKQGARRKAGVQVEGGLPTGGVTEEDLAKVRQLTSGEKLHASLLDPRDSAPSVISPEDFFKNSSGLTGEARERANNPFLQEAREAFANVGKIKEYASVKALNAAQSAKAEAQRRSDIANTGVSRQVGTIVVPDAEKASAKSFKAPVKIQTEGTGTPKFNIDEDLNTNEVNRLERFRQAREGISGKLISVAPAPQVGAMANANLPSLEDLTEKQNEESVRNQAGIETQASVEREAEINDANAPTVDATANRKQNEAIGSDSIPEVGTRAAPGDREGASTENPAISDVPGDVARVGKGAIKAGAMQGVIAAAVDQGSALDRAKAGGIATGIGAASDVAGQVGARAGAVLGDVGKTVGGFVGGIAPVVGLELAGPGSAEQKAKTVGITAGIQAGQEAGTAVLKKGANAAADFVKGNIDKATKASAKLGDLGSTATAGLTAEEAGDTALAIDAATGGPEDPIGDVISGVVGLGMLLGGIFGKKHDNKPPPPPPPRPVLNPATSLGI